MATPSRLPFVLLCLLGAAPLAAQAPPLELERLAGPIELDGAPDEAAWVDVAPLPLTMYAPTFRGTPGQRTEIRVAYDDEHLYAAGWFYDDDAGGIRINSLYRDRWNGDDAFAIYVDAFNDDRNAKWFGTTPGGIRFDQAISDDGATLNASWDGFWSSRTTVGVDGWFAEVRIPFSTLGFQPGPDGAVVMGLTVTRLVSRTGERVTFPDIDPGFEFRNPSAARDVVLRDVRSRRPLYVTPYVLGGVDRAPAPGSTSFEMRSVTSSEAGLDVRYPISPTLTLDVTVNTDFAQVEADDQQVNLDRFPLFYPERRRFFQENSGLFDWTTGGGGRLFHSRRIGLTPDFTPVPVLGGARVVGRVGSWDVGVLDMQTEALGPYPSENFGVVRLRRPFLNSGSTAGILATSYVGGGRHSLGLGADGLLRVGTNHYIGAKWAATVDEAEPDGVGLADRSIVDLRWERRTGRGLQFDANLTRSGPAFEPELGFQPRDDFSRAAVSGNWFIFTDDDPLLRRILPGALAFQTWRNTDGALESGTWAFWLQWETKADGGGWIEPKWFREDVVEPFEIGGVTIPAGTYDFADLQLVLSMSPGARLRTTLDARAGTYFDGTRAQVIVGPTWNVSPHLELGGSYQLTALRFPDRGQRTDIHVGRLRVRSALNASASGNAFVQYNSTTERLDFNVRLRYAFAEGTDLWLVYNEGLDTAYESDPAAVGTPLSVHRALILKYTHTFGF